MRVTDFLPARRPFRRRGRGVSLPGRCSGPFRPISTPGGRCCSLPGLGPRTPAPLASTGRSLAASRLQPAPGACSGSAPPPLQALGDLPRLFGSGLQSLRARPLASPSLRTPRRGHTQTHPHRGRLRRLHRVPGRRPLPPPAPHLCACSCLAAHPALFFPGSVPSPCPLSQVPFSHAP